MITQQVGHQGHAVNIDHGNIKNEETQFLIGIILIIQHGGLGRRGRLVNHRGQRNATQQVIPIHCLVACADAIPLSCDKSTGLGIQCQCELFGIIGFGCASHEVERIDLADKDERTEILAVFKHIAVALAMSLHPCRGQIRAQTLHIDVITVKANFGATHQGIALKPFVNVLIVTHVITRQQIGLRFQVFRNNDGVDIGRDVHLAVIHVIPAHMVGIGILKDVAHLLLIQNEDIGTAVIIEHGIDGHVLILQGSDGIEIDVVAIQTAEVLSRESHG